MKFQAIEIENFGVFRDRRFTFSGGTFHLIHGPNEAGKSTLLALIRQLLFGFDVQNKYAFPGQGEMAATAKLAMADGRRVEYRRRKGAKNTVVGTVGEHGAPLDEAALEQVLGKAGQGLFTNVFSFSLAELTAGGESLAGAGFEDALYGSGVGGLKRFQESQKAIEKELDALFKSAKTATAPRINKLAGELTKTNHAIAAAIIKPADYKQQCQERDELLSHEQHLREQCVSLDARCKRLEQIGEGLPLWRRLADAQAELAALSAPDGLPENLAEQYRSAQQRMQQAGEDLEDFMEKGRQTSAELAALQWSPELIGREPDILSLFQQVKSVRDCREKSPRLRSEAQALRGHIEAAVATLNPKWDITILDEFQTGLAERERVERMATEAADGQKRLGELVSQKKEKDAKLENDRRTLEQLRTVAPAPQLEALCAQEGQYRADREGLDRIHLNLKKIARRIISLNGRLTASLPVDAERLVQLVLPLPSAVEPFKQRFQDGRAAEREVKQRVEDACDHLANLAADLAGLSAKESIPDRQQLLAQRGHRDAGWRLIRRAFIEGEDLSADIAAWSADRQEPVADLYERETAEADRLADDRQAKAELVAKHDQLADEIARKNRSLVDLQQRLAEREREAVELHEQWNALWSAAGIVPLEPAAMLEWLQLHESLLNELAAQAEEEARRRLIEGRVAQFEAELKTVAEDGGSIEGRLLDAQRRVRDANDAAAQRTLLESGLPAQRQELDAIAADLAAAEAEQTQWDAQWQSLLAEFGFPPQWDVGTARKILAGLSQARQELQTVRVREQQAADMEAQVAAFTDAVARLGSLDGQSLGQLPAEIAVERWSTALTAAKQARDRHALLTQQRMTLENQAAAKLSQQQAAAAQTEQLRLLAGATTEQQFFAITGDARRMQQLRGEIAAIRGELRRIAKGIAEAEFHGELAGADPDAIRLAAEEARERLDRLKEDARHAGKAAAVKVKEVEDLDKEGDTLELLQQRESSHAELRAEVDRFALLKMAHAMLRESLVRFEREHQPAILEEVAALFSKMTHGRYQGIRQKLDEKGTLLVAAADQSTKEPRQLSTGTREQLHLALRLAHARHYCRNSEPLPLVMDDVLVNFDDRRADQTLDVLANLDPQMQVIFLTCHQATVDRILARVPDLRPTELSVL